MPKLIKLLVSILVCESVGIFGAVFTNSQVTVWYSYLNKPPFSPPNYVFAPVWTILYALMGVTLYLIWTKKNVKDSIKNNAYITFFTQLILNFTWSVIFFGNKSPLGGLIIIAILWLAIFETIRRTYQVDKMAATLLYPYLVWVSFAALLNLSIVLLNP